MGCHSRCCQTCRAKEPPAAKFTGSQLFCKNWGTTGLTCSSLTSKAPNMRSFPRSSQRRIESSSCSSNSTTGASPAGEGLSELGWLSDCSQKTGLLCSMFPHAVWNIVSCAGGECVALDTHWKATDVPNHVPRNPEFDNRQKAGWFGDDTRCRFQFHGRRVANQQL